MCEARSERERDSRRRAPPPTRRSPRQNAAADAARVLSRNERLGSKAKGPFEKGVRVFLYTNEKQRL